MTAPKKKDAPKTLIYKPYLRGTWASAAAARRGARIFLYVAVSAFFYLFLGQALAIGSPPLRILLNVAVLAGFGALLYAEGMKAGEDDVAFAQIALKRKEAGQAITRAEVDRCFHPLKGFFTALMGVLPFILLALALAVLTGPQQHLGTLPAWLTPYLRREDISLALSYYQNGQGLGMVDILRMVVRAVIFPLVNIVGSKNEAGILLLERLSPLAVCLAPLGYALGYWRGEAARARVHGEIADDTRRRVRRQNREKRLRQPRKPDQLV